MREMDRCALCGEDVPAELVSSTTVATLGPMEVDVCAPCELTHSHQYGDGQCEACGADVGAGYYVELEFPIGPDAIRGTLAGYLCHDCAEDAGWRILHHAVSTDDAAKERLVELLDRDAELRRAAEGGSGGAGA